MARVGDRKVRCVESFLVVVEGRTANKWMSGGDGFFIVGEGKGSCMDEFRLMVQVEGIIK